MAADKIIHFWFGEDDFSISEKLARRKADFAKKHGAMNIYEIDWKYDSADEREKMSRLQVGLSSDSLFSSDKLLILKNVLSVSKKKREKGSSDDEADEDKGSAKDDMILKYFAKPKDGIELFIVEEGVDQRKKTYKDLVRLEKEGMAELKEFLLPVDRGFDAWIRQRIEKNGGQIKKDALDILSVSLGKGFSQRDRNKKVTQSYNLWEADNEIGKLVCFAEERDITKEDIELLVRSKVDMNIFSLTDSISRRDKQKAILMLNMQIEKGVNEIYILTMLIRQFRNLLIIKDLLEEGLSDSQVAQRAKMHPFVVKKTIEQCRNFKLPDLKKIYRKLYDADVAIKTGKMESGLALDLLVVSIA